MFASAAILLLAASPALANLFMTSPVASTVWTAGQQVSISWEDDGQSPSLAELGNCSVGVFVGSATQQTQIQQVVASVNVASTSSIVFTPDATAGADSAGYFIRVESLTAKDATNSAYPAEAFSAKFQLTAMTGSFSAAVQAQIDGASASGAASAAPSASASASATSLASTSKAASTSSHAASSSASATASKNGAASLAGSAVACIAGVAVTFAMLF